MSIDKNELLGGMVANGIYELHLIPGSPVLYRNKVGDIIPLGNDVLSPDDTKEFAGEILSPEQRAEFLNTNEIDCALSVPGQSRYRFSVSMQRSSISVVIRTYPTNIPTFEELRLHKTISEIVRDIQKGLVIVAGPKGGGKSTTLASIINYMLKERPLKILTFENPIRFLFKNQKGVICQREAGLDVKNRSLFFENVINQSADALVVDDVYNLQELNSLLLMSAGGIVILKMIATSLVPAIERLINMYPVYLQDNARNTIASSLEAGFSQVLCRHTDKKTLIPAMEIYRSSNIMRQHFKDNKLQQVYQVMGGAGREAGMTNQEASLRMLVKNNQISKDEAMLRTSRPDEMKKLFSQAY